MILGYEKGLVIELELIRLSVISRDQIVVGKAKQIKERQVFVFISTPTFHPISDFFNSTGCAHCSSRLQHTMKLNELCSVETVHHERKAPVETSCLQSALCSNKEWFFRVLRKFISFMHIVWLATAYTKFLDRVEHPFPSITKNA